MSKSKRSSQPKQVTVKEGLVVKAIDSIMNDCLSVIKPAINNRELGFSRIDLAKRRTKCNITGRGSSTAFAREQYTVHEILAKGYTTYWLAICIYFQFLKGEYMLDSVSLVVFKGLRTDETKTALLRAEWECAPSITTTSHAQPHWHIYPALINEDSNRSTEEFDTSIEVQKFGSDEGESINDDVAQMWKLERFHFAMASQWHLKDDCSHQEKLEDIEVLKRWIKGCVNYIKGQLEYLPT